MRSKGKKTSGVHMQERRRCERAELQRVRAEKERDRQTRIAVRGQCAEMSLSQCLPPTQLLLFLLFLLCTTRIAYMSFLEKVRWTDKSLKLCDSDYTIPEIQ